MTHRDIMQPTKETTLQNVISAGIKLTPMMEQYAQIKENYPDMLLMFRMGDFYEVFFEDAKAASKILNISLTHRGKLGDIPIPMAGIPHHAASTYIDRITSAGMKVAICEQIEDPKVAKGIVKRAVTQVVSPGMPYDLDKSEQRENSYMASAIKTVDSLYLVLLDYTTGDFFGISLKNEDELLEKLFTYAPKEFLTFADQWSTNEQLGSYLKNGPLLVTYLSPDIFSPKFTEIYTQKLIPSFQRDEVLKIHDGILGPVGALCYYVSSTQTIENAEHIRPFQMVNNDDQMKITYPTLLGLEIFPKNKEDYKNSILGFMDTTATSMGARKLKILFQNPIRDKHALELRYDCIDYFKQNENILESIREVLSEVRDLERIMAKVTSGKVNGGDLINLARGHRANTEIITALKKFPKGALDSFTKSEELKLVELTNVIEATINDEIGANLEKGNLIKAGADKKRDKLAQMTSNATEALKELEIKYREATGIPNLKIKFNNVAGYFIEISKSHTKKVPKDFIRRQTLVNSERYQNEEVAEFEKEMLSAKDKLQKLEREIFDSIVTKVKEASAEILKLSQILGYVDCLASLAYVSQQAEFTRPILNSEEKVLDIVQAWHPIIKAKIKDQFVCHNLKLNSKKYFGLITGPNMAGKTTVMREMAIIQFLAQIGCFVPAKKAEVGLCDYIFSRLGAHDDIVRGQSTFMVEMSETAEIIRHATENSLIILDEIGRGTSTYDGLSIAWSLVEYFHNKTKAMTLFSTHYHELIELVDELEHAMNLTVKTVNNNGNVQFLYELIHGGAAQSFGIHVAKLAGLPPQILKRSASILKDLEQGQTDHHAKIRSDLNQLDMFSPIEMPTHLLDENLEKIIEELKAIDLMNQTPIQVLNKIHEFQKQLIH